MYIVRPLREGEQRSLSSAFATHPPLEKRIRVLRNMGGNADFSAYDQAYAQVTGQHVIGARTLGATAPTATETPASESDLAGAPDRLRAASDAYLAGAGYERIECASCGAVVKVPAQHRGRAVACPRCRAPL
jgi:hypothetical protein